MKIDGSISFPSMYRFVAVFVFYLLIGIANTAVQVSKSVFVLLSFHEFCLVQLPCRRLFVKAHRMESMTISIVLKSRDFLRYFVTDSNGKKCSREFFDSATGCCRNGDAFTCEGCGEDQCCDLYETCVSCCLSPKNSPDEKYRNAFRYLLIDFS